LIVFFIVFCNVFLEVFLDVFFGDFLTDPFAVFLANSFAVLPPISLIALFDIRFVYFRSVVMAVASLVQNRVFGGKNVAEFEDEFEPGFDDSFAAEFVVRTGAVALTFVRPEVSYGRETTAAALHRDIGLRFQYPNR
jgi:membrane-bound metal-dependent hydrolase YbcI (DUF457 family)